MLEKVIKRFFKAWKLVPIGTIKYNAHIHTYNEYDPHLTAYDQELYLIIRIFKILKGYTPPCY